MAGDSALAVREIRQKDRGKNLSEKKIFEKQKASCISTFSKNHENEKNILHSVRIMSALAPTMQNFVVNSPAPKLSAASDTSKTPAKTISSGSERERERERERFGSGDRNSAKQNKKSRTILEKRKYGCRKPRSWSRRVRNRPASSVRPGAVIEGFP